MKKLYTFLIATLLCTCTFAQNVTINGNKFNVSGKEIWFNGINTPWHLFDDFGRNDFDASWWETEFAKYANNNINLARVWIHGSGEISPDIDANGFVTGANDKFWEHMDVLIEVSKKNKVYVMPALFSFDITKNSYPTHQQWRSFLQSKEKIQSYIDHVLIPLIKKYEGEPYLLAWEICNEPEWMFENTEHGPQSFDDVQLLHAMLAAAIHKNVSTFVTTGSAAPKWNSPIYDSWGEKEGNMFSDEALEASAKDSLAYLDFYQYHWYPWQTEWMESPFSQTTVEYDVDDRPVIVGESEGNDVCDKFLCQTVSEMYENAYLNGFDGVCAWKTPQNDGHGTFENIAVATNNFYENHPHLVYPEMDPISVESISISPSSLIIEVNDKVQLTATILPSNATDKTITWSTSNSNLATVTDGLVSGMDTGTVVIKGITNDGSYSDSCIVIVNPDTPPEMYTLNTYTNGEGTISLSPAGGYYEEGTSISISAVANSGYQFSEWTGDISASSKDTVIVINNDMELTAIFIEYTSPCGTAENIEVPFTKNGVGEFCWVTDKDIDYINSWNLDLLEINGVDLTNSWSNSFPEKINGNYYIHYVAKFNWSHFEANSSLKSATKQIDEITSELSVAPNPFTTNTQLSIPDISKVITIRVIDSTGKTVETIQKSNINSITQIGQSLPKGIYFVSIYTKDKGINTVLIKKE